MQQNSDMSPQVWGKLRGEKKRINLQNIVQYNSKQDITSPPQFEIVLHVGQFFLRMEYYKVSRLESCHV